MLIISHLRIAPAPRSVVVGGVPPPGIEGINHGGVDTGSDPVLGGHHLVVGVEGVLVVGVEGVLVVEV